MDQFQKDILAIINNVLNGQDNKISAQFSYEKCFEFAKLQQLQVILFEGLKGDEEFKNSPVFADFSMECKKLVSHSIVQDYEVKALFSKFDSANISYAPMKGSLLKDLYPNDLYRSMSDADILIKVDEYPKIKQIMLDLGFIEKGETDQDYAWQKPSCLIELHKALISESNKDFYKYFDTGWKLLKNIEGTTRYEFSPEDNYIYLYTHFAKHYRNAGVGIKYVIDFYVYKKAYKDMDKEYLKEQFKKLNLYDFYVNMERLLEVWFDGKESDEKTDFITNELFGSFVYGFKEKSRLMNDAKAYKKNGNSKFARFITMLFPSYRVLKFRYKALRKCPILLPVIWIWRFIEVIFSPKRFKIAADRLTTSNQEKANTYYDRLKYIGLDLDLED